MSRVVLVAELKHLYGTVTFEEETDSTSKMPKNQYDSILRKSTRLLLIYATCTSMRLARRVWPSSASISWRIQSPPLLMSKMQVVQLSSRTCRISCVVSYTNSTVDSIHPRNGGHRCLHSQSSDLGYRQNRILSNSAMSKMDWFQACEANTMFSKLSMFVAGGYAVQDAEVQTLRLEAPCVWVVWNQPWTAPKSLLQPGRMQSNYAGTAWTQFGSDRQFRQQFVGTVRSGLALWSIVAMLHPDTGFWPMLLETRHMVSARTSTIHWRSYKLLLMSSEASTVIKSMTLLWAISSRLALRVSSHQKRFNYKL